MDDVVKEFLIETRENLDKFDRDLVALEKDPASRKTLASIFRTIHTLKGTCGFLTFERLEVLAHAAENLLSLMRDGRLAINAEIASALLATGDTIRTMLSNIETTGTEGAAGIASLVETFNRLQNGAPAIAAPTVADAPGATGTAHPADTSVRVSVALLDQLMDMVGELVLTRNQILQCAADLANTAVAGASQRLNLITTELQERVMKTRMEPIGNVWNKFPRLVRDLEHTCGKKVRLTIDGADTELDRTLLEAIKDPLAHLVRNAIDHGIEAPDARRGAGKPEEGRLSMRAYHEGGLVNIEMSDDGAGIDAARVREHAVARGLISAENAARISDREAIEMIFLPGFSTAEKVSNISGRGVGMDVVKTHIERIGGIVDVLTEMGRGTTFKIKIPLTLAIIPALTVSCGGDRYAIPQVNVVELLRIENSRGLESVHGAPVHRLRGSLLPVLRLASELQVEAGGAAGAALQIVVVQAGERRFGLVVEDVYDAGEIVVKSLGRLLKGTPCFAGATIMGDGTVALILDVFSLARRAEMIAGETRAPSAATPAPQAASEAGEDLLIFGVGARHMAMPLSAVARLEEFPRQSIERAGSLDAVQYHGQILPLISVAEAFNVASDSPLSDTVQAIVYTENGRSAGLVVSRIEDIVREAGTMHRGTPQRGVLGSAVIGGRVTDLLDVREIIRAEDPTFFEEVAP